MPKQSNGFDICALLLSGNLAFVNAKAVYRWTCLLSMCLAILFSEPTSLLAQNSVEQNSVERNSVEQNGDKPHRSDRMQIKTLFDSYQQSTADQSGVRLIQHFDMAKLVEASISMADISVPDTFKQHLVESLGESYRVRLRQKEGKWKRHKILSIAFTDSGAEASVFLRRTSEGQAIGRALYSLHRTEKGWLLYDYFDLSTGVSLTSLTATAALFLQSQDLSQEVVDYRKLLGEGTFALWRGNRSGGRRCLDELLGRQVPSYIRKMRWIVESDAATQIQSCEGLHLLDKLSAFDPEFPVTDLLRAKMYNAILHPEPAIKYARRYLDRFGSDPEAYTELGLAYLALKRNAEAIAAFQQALNDSPEMVAALDHLALALPEGSKGEIASWFSKVPDKTKAFPRLAESFESRQDVDAMRFLVDSMEEHAPEEVSLAYYRGWLLGEQGRHDEAFDVIFKQFKSLARTNEFFSAYERLVCIESVRADRALELYDSQDNPDIIFENLIYYATECAQFDSVASVIAKHLKAFPENVEAMGMAGGLEFQAKRYQRADRYFADAISVLLKTQENSPWILESLLHQRMDCWDQMQGLSELYESLEPKEVGFEMLGTRLIEDKNRQDDLEKLITQRTAEAPKSFGLLKIKARFRFAQQRYKQVIEMIGPLVEGDAPPEILGGSPKEDAGLLELYVRSLIRDKQLVRATSAVDLIPSGTKQIQMQIVVHAAKGDQEKCQALCATAIQEHDFFVEDLIDDPDVPSGTFAPTSAPVENGDLPQLRRLVFLLPQAITFDGQALPQAIEKAWHKPVSLIDSQDRDKTKGDYVLRLGKNAAVVSAGGSLFFLSKGDGAYQQGAEMFFENCDRPDLQPLVEKHQGWVSVDALFWSPKPGEQSYLLPLPTQQKIAQLATALAGESPIVALDPLGYSVGQATSEFLIKLCSDVPYTAFETTR